MRKSKIIIFFMIIIIILGISTKSLAANFDLNVFFNGKDIRMESETTDMSWNLENFLPGSSDTSSITISNAGEKKATVETRISIEEDTGLLEMINLEIKNNAGETVYKGTYTDLEKVSKTLEPGENETYTVKTTLNVNAGNEYQNKQYKLKFDFKAIGEIPNGILTVKYVDENGEQLQEDEVTTKKIGNTYELPQTGKTFTDYEFVSVDGQTSGEYVEEGTTITYHYKKVKYGKLIVKHVDKQNNILEQESNIQPVGTPYILETIGKEISGYKFEKVEGQTSGEYKQTDTTVTYIYDKIDEIKMGKLIIKYVDQDGKILQEDDIKTGQVETTYEIDTIGKTIEGYDFVTIKGEYVGMYKEEDTIVTYEYKKIKYGKLIILCIDENNELIERTITIEKVGTSYSLDSIGKIIEGYKFIGFEGKINGEYKEEDTIITYKYEKEKNSEIITDKVTLPQTGENRQQFFILIGAIVVIAILLYIGKKRLNSK